MLHRLDTEGKFDRQQRRRQDTGHTGSLNGLTSMKAMWIIQPSQSLNPYEDLWEILDKCVTLCNALYYHHQNTKKKLDL